MEVMPARTVVWWSGGAASTIALMLALRDDPDTVAVYCDPGAEHPDVDRFRTDVSVWLDTPIQVIRSAVYANPDAVWDARRYVVGPEGAPCTLELKKRPRQQFERPDDRQVYGYTVEEARPRAGRPSRIDAFRAANPEVDVWFPVADAGWTKPECLGMLEQAGIELPAMYRLGYRNANCIGCPHGGMGYWNMIRRDFSDVFERMARREREINHACCRPGGVPVFLDELDPDRGDIYDEPDVECGLFCASEVSAHH